MAISKIGNLFAANVDSINGQAQYKQQAQAESQSATTKQSGNQSSEAAVFSFSSNNAPTQGSDVDRAAKVAALRNQVSSGSYSVDSKALATTVVRDLL